MTGRLERMDAQRNEESPTLFFRASSPNITSTNAEQTSIARGSQISMRIAPGTVRNITSIINGED